MKNYNYYDRLTKDYNDSLSVLSGGSSAPVKRKREEESPLSLRNIPPLTRGATQTTTFDKPAGSGYNGGIGNTYKPTYGNVQNQWGANAEANHDLPAYGKKTQQYPIHQPLGDTFSARGKALPDISTDAFKQKAQNQWYNKITHGSFKEDDWFGGMVKNQQNAESWYKSTYGENEGKKEYDNLHNRLVTTPFDKIKEEEKQFANYKVSDFKVPEIKPVKYSYSGRGSKGELSGEKTGCYKKGDENLPFLTNYIINGNDGKTGGLNKVWQNASSAEERARIEKVAEMLRAEETDYDITKSSEVLILYDAEGAYGNGHTAVIIKNSDGQGVYFSYAEEGKFLWGDGEVSFDILNREQMDLFLTDGNMRYIGTSSGTIDYQHYTDYIKIPITSEQGASMIGKGIGYFINPGKYLVTKWGDTNQCDSVVSNILNSGDVNYDSKWRPIKSFYDYSTENGYQIFSITE